MLEIYVGIGAIVVPVAILIAKAINGQRTCLMNQDKRSFRQSQALIVLANELDDLHRESHPSASPAHLGKKIDTILRDENGNL